MDRGITLVICIQGMKPDAYVNVQRRIKILVCVVLLGYQRNPQIQKHLGKSNIRMHVYGRSKDRLGYNVERCKTKDKRTSHWVPAIQTIS